MKEKLSFLVPGELDPVRPSGAGPSPTEGRRKKSKDKKIKPKNAYSNKQSEDRTQKKDRPKQGRIDIEA